MVSISDVVDEIERICLEHRAMALLLEQELGGSWVSAANTYKAGERPKSVVRAQFQSLRDSISSGESEKPMWTLLMEALSKSDLYLIRDRKQM